MATRVGGIKSLHWRYAILTAIRLRNSEGLVENDVLEALKITLHPPSPPTAASPELIDSIWSFISEDDEVAVRQIYIEQTRTNSSSQIAIGSSNCEYLLRAYKNMSIRTYVKGYCKTENHCLETPPISSRRRSSYRVQIRTSFTIQYAHGVPYRMCVIAQSRHPGDERLSGLEVVTILLLAIESYKNAPNEPIQTVRVFAVDTFSVRRLSARIPSTYARSLIRSAENAAPDEPDGEITIEPTPYFDISNDQGLESVLAALLEDEGQREPSPELGSNLDRPWLASPEAGAGGEASPELGSEWLQSSDSDADIDEMW